MVVFFTGGHGTSWWTATPETTQFADDLRARGFGVAQVRWRGSWLKAPSGVDTGTAHLACYPATVIDQIHQDLYLPLGVTPDGIGACGFCITGNSGGASQVAFAVSHYGLEGILDAVIPTGGPPHAALSKSCSADPAFAAYSYSADTRNFIDQGFGFARFTGPCYRQDPSFGDRWSAESVATGGSDYVHERTRMEFIFGDADAGMQTVGGDYVARLQDAGTPYLYVSTASNTSHDVAASAEGRALLLAALLREGVAPEPPGGASVSITDEGFTPSAIEVSQGTPVTWRVTGTTAKQVADASGMGLFRSPRLDPGASYTFDFFGAGTYRYNDPRRPLVFNGQAAVPLQIPAEGVLGSDHPVVFAAAPPPPGFVFDIQIKRPGSTSFIDWRTGLTGTEANFRPGRTGTFSFRAHLKNVGSGVTSAWSPVAQIIVT